jgi:hypothetical protein
MVKIQAVRCVDQLLAGSKMLAIRILVICLALLELAGCVGAQIQPDPEGLSRVRNIEFVPMETPPLIINQHYLEGQIARREEDINAIQAVSSILFQSQLGLLLMVSTFPGYLLRELESRQMDYPAPVEMWIPTVEFAREASRLVAATGKASTISAEVQPIPGIQDRRRSLLMENWLGSIRDWYNDASPSAKYAALAVKGVDLIAEVGISNYEIGMRGNLLLQVSVKLIDPRSGQLVGRARAYSSTDFKAIDKAFDNDAKPFKDFVLQASNQLVLTCLRELRLVPK